MTILFLPGHRDSGEVCFLNLLRFYGRGFGLADGAAFEAMEQTLPAGPALLFYFVLPSGSEYSFLDLGIADTHAGAPKITAY